MISRHNHQTNIYIEESPKREIKNPDYLLQMDKIVFTNNESYTVSNVNENEIEVISKKTIKKSELQEFLSGMSHVVRADCFEL